VGASYVAGGIGAVPTPHDTRTIRHEVRARGMSFRHLRSSFSQTTMAQRKSKPTPPQVSTIRRVFQTGGMGWQLQTFLSLHGRFSSAFFAFLSTLLVSIIVGSNVVLTV
jgi:hypothetical protein